MDAAYGALGEQLRAAQAAVRVAVAESEWIAAGELQKRADELDRRLAKQAFFRTFYGVASLRPHRTLFNAIVISWSQPRNCHFCCCFLPPPTIGRSQSVAAACAFRARGDDLH